MNFPRKAFSVLLAICALAVGATSAGAATTVGQTFAPGINSLPHTLNFASAVATGNSNQVSSDGVLTSFSHIAEASPDATLTFVVMRNVGTGYQVVGMSDVKTLISAVLNSWPTRIPVKNGDLIGVYGSTPNLAAASSAGGGNIFLGISPPSLAVGDVVTTGPSNVYGDGSSGYILDIAAQLEPDADGDGFGDESQDACPTNASTQGVCPDLTAPVLKLKFSKTVKSTKSLSITVTPNEAAKLAVSGKVKVGKKSYKVKSSSKNVTAGKASKLKISVPSKARGKAAKATITLKATDTAGNKKTYTAKITIKKKG